MNRELARKVADAVLYEGYMLYPYRRSSIKNQQRWSFGILYPPEYPEVKNGTERSLMHSECLLETDDHASSIEVQLRFLQILREPGAANSSLAVEARPAGVNDPSAETAQQIIERSVEFRFPLNGGAHVGPFSFPAAHRQLRGAISLACERAADSVMKLAIEVKNETTLAPALDRDSALLCSLLSAHTILTADGARFVSLLDPPAHLCQAVGTCKNLGNFPVLVGNAGERDMLLCSPIVLYDHPQIAPESVGDFYDATEMDEMLTLRVMTLTEGEKEQMRVADARTRELLGRTEQSVREQLAKTHGTFRPGPTTMRPPDTKSAG
jgi:hypothetical protein